MFDVNLAREQQVMTNDPGLGRRQRPRRFLTTVAAIVAVTFTMTVLAPTAMAARTGIEAARMRAAPPSGDEAGLAKTVLKIQSTLEKLSDKLARGDDARREKQELRALDITLRKLDRAVRANFDAAGALVRGNQLPPVIQQRHDDTVAVYHAAFDALAAQLATALESSDAALVEQAVQSALWQLKSKQFRRRHQPFHPEDLRDFTTPDPTNVPRMTKDEYISAALYDRPLIRLAANEGFRLGGLAGADNPAFLAETPEVRLTRVIEDKAAELGHDPVTIYRWVRNNIEWMPSWGARQDAELTLAAGRGNSMEIASLTIALLRVSGIPARYVHGVIAVPADEFVNWAGDFADAAAARDFVARGGIPSTVVVSGGEVSQVRLEHIWVEVAADYFPSRGAINKAADSWVRLDPSFKQYDNREGLDVVAIGGLDPEALAKTYVDSGTVNETEGWVSGFDPTLLQGAQAQVAQQLDDYIANNLADPTVADIIGGRPAIIEELSTLPSSLDNRIVFEGATYDNLPDALRLHLTLALGRELLGEPVDPVNYRWTDLNNKKLTLSFRPATVADEEALASFLPKGDITDASQLPDYIPSYLISVIPELRLEGEVIHSGTAVSLGEEIDLYHQVKTPRQVFPGQIYHAIAGSYLALTPVGGNVSPLELEQTRARIEQTRAVLESQNQAQSSALTRENLLGDIFHAGLLGYWAQYSALGHLMALAQRASTSLAVGYGTYGYEPAVDTFFGIPRGIRPGGVAMNVYLTNYDATHTVDAEARKNFNIQLGALSSTLEHAVPEQMFNADASNPPDAMSAVKALSMANVQGQRIYQVAQDNLYEALPNLHLYSETEDEIRQAVLAGKTVITHTDPVSVPGWTGAGYAIVDPNTGVGIWKISGGQNGGILIFESILEIFWWGFDQVKGIAKANVIVSAASFASLVTKIVNECRGSEQWSLIYYLTAYTVAIILLSVFVTPGALLAYALLFNFLSTLVFDQAVQRDC
jgi:transglutaminase-like putative cysteine protease